MQFLDGKKLWLGAVGLVGGVIWQAMNAHPDCTASWQDAMSQHAPTFVTGMGALLASLGYVHKREKKKALTGEHRAAP